MAATWHAVRDTQFYMNGIVGSETVARDEAIAVLWQQQRSRLVRLAVGLTGDRDAAEEIVQEAFATLLGRWRFLRDVSAAQAYLHRAVVNQAQARWRARRRSQVASEVLPGRREQSADPDLDSQLDMLTALGRLPWGKRAACRSPSGRGRLSAWCWSGGAWTNLGPHACIERGRGPARVRRVLHRGLG
jgi:Sigma-70 region 2